MTKFSSSNNSFLQNKGDNDDLLLVQEIKRQKENGPCTFLIERHIVIKYHISSWALYDADDGPECSEYDLNVGHNAPLPQYIHVEPWRCGSICDKTSRTLNNTIHLKIKTHELYEKSISVPISCKYISLPSQEELRKLPRSVVAELQYCGGY